MSASAPRFTDRKLAIAALCACAALVAAAPGFAQDPDVGLSAVRAQRFGRPQLPNANPEGTDSFGHAFAVGDFDGDGVDDLATGAPLNDGPAASPVDACGQVVVRYGVEGRGLDAVGAPTVLGQFLAGSTNPAEAGDVFGQALAACDMDGDGFDDLAVGVPGEDLVVVNTFFIPDAGVVEVYRGSSGGLVAPAAIRVRDVTGTAFPVAGAFFGSTVACADFDADGFDDLAVGMPNRTVEGVELAGRLNVFRGGASPILGNAYVRDQFSLGLGGVEAGDHYASALAAGDFDDDGFADLAVGVPGELHQGIHFGAVQVLFGSLAELGIAGAEDVSNSGAGVGLSYGAELAVGDFDADGVDDLAVGAALFDLGTTDSGVIFAYPGSTLRIFPTSSDRLAPNSIFGDGASHEEEHFGSSLAAGDFDGDGVDDLAVGSPGEELIPDRRNGAVTVAMGVAGVGLLPSPGRARQINSGAEGFPGSLADAVVGFGATLAAGDFDADGYSDLAVGAPDEVELGIPQVGTATVLYGALFADGVGSGSPTYWSVAVPGP